MGPPGNFGLSCSISSILLLFAGTAPIFDMLGDVSTPNMKWKVAKEQPRRAVKGLTRMGWHGCGGTLDGRGCSGRLRPARGPVLLEEEEPEPIAMLSFFHVGNRWPWGVPAHEWGK